MTRNKPRTAPARVVTGKPANGPPGRPASKSGGRAAPSGAGDGPMRLQRYLAMGGTMARRKAEDAIVAFPGSEATARMYAIPNILTTEAW